MLLKVNARSEADVVLMDEVVAVFRGGLDVHLYVVSFVSCNNTHACGPVCSRLHYSSQYSKWANKANMR